MTQKSKNDRKTASTESEKTSQTWLHVQSPFIQRSWNTGKQQPPSSPLSFQEQSSNKL